MTGIRGVVRDGVVVFDPPTDMPDGTEVNITVNPIPFTPEEQAEFAMWEKLGDEAWAMIVDMEREEGISCEKMARECEP